MRRYLFLMYFIRFFYYADFSFLTHKMLRFNQSILDGSFINLIACQQNLRPLKLGRGAQIQADCSGTVTPEAHR